MTENTNKKIVKFSIIIKVVKKIKIGVNGNGADLRKYIEAIQY